MTRNIKDVELLHRIAIESGKGKEHSHDDHSRLLRVGYLGTFRGLAEEKNPLESPWQ